ncbi:MAG TPA: acylphosphatase [Spirochaetota bacterium]
MAYEIILGGRVQGVGCRFYCAHVGRELNIRGSATNLPDGTVSVVLDTDDREIAERYAIAAKDNLFGIHFSGKIISASVLAANRPVHGDYDW